MFGAQWFQMHFFDILIQKLLKMDFMCLRSSNVVYEIILFHYFL